MLGLVDRSIFSSQQGSFLLKSLVVNGSCCPFVLWEKHELDASDPLVEDRKGGV